MNLSQPSNLQPRPPYAVPYVQDFSTVQGAFAKSLEQVECQQ